MTSLLADLGQPAYRAAQLWRWLYVQRAATWDAMTNLSGALRKDLESKLCIRSTELLKMDGESGGTRKLLVGLRDGERVEAVLIPADDRRTVCLSSQVGCRFRCAFCASGQAGFLRNLDAGEMVGQVLLAAEGFGDKPTHVVVMGVGEPFDNYEAVLKAVRIINDQDGLCIGARRITISTSGVIPGIERLAGEGLQVELSVSLHAPDSELRSRLMPVNERYPLADLMKACQAYFDQTGRLITFEYTLIRGVNDRPEQARALAKLLSGFPARVNFIPLSPVAEFDGEPPAPGTAESFIQVLDRAGINATLRASRGTDVNAACGQLRIQHEHDGQST